MKNLFLALFFLLNCFGTVIYAQSKKKLNVELTNRLSVEKAKYDSLATLYNNNLSALQSARSLAGNTLYKNLGNINYGIEERRYELRKQLSILQSLNFKDIPAFKIYNEQLTFYYALKAKMETQFDFDFPERKAIPPLNLTDTRKLVDRNSKMSAQIRWYKEESQALSSDIASMLEKKVQLNAFNFSSDSLVLEYSDELNRLTECFNQVKRTLLSAREEFVQKGPKGFNAFYFKAFPDVFPDVVANEAVKYKSVEEPDTVSHSQDDRSIDPKTETVYDFLEQEAVFPGGRDSLVAFLASNIHYPDFAFTNKIGGKCFVRFIVSKDGKISNVKIERGVPDCRECDEEAVRVMLSMPAWKPGEENGVAVNQWCLLPIIFKRPD